MTATIAAGGQHLASSGSPGWGGRPVTAVVGVCPSFVLACWVPLSGAGAVRCHCGARARRRVVLILILAWFIVVARWIGCRVAGAGSSVVMVLTSFASSPVSSYRPSPFIVVTPSPIPVVCRSPSPSPDIRFLSVVAPPSILQAGLTGWHKAGCSLPYNILKNLEGINTVSWLYQTKKNIGPKRRLSSFEPILCMM